VGIYTHGYFFHLTRALKLPASIRSGSAMNNNQDSLRTQIIAAMSHEGRLQHGWSTDTVEAYVVQMFDNAIMPVLTAAMEAGELLLHRATTPQKPVADAIMDWLDACCAMTAKLHGLEDTASKRELLRIIYQLEENAIKALADARKLSQGAGISISKQ
jgi:hypothetical protein